MLLGGPRDMTVSTLLECEPSGRMQETGETVKQKLKKHMRGKGRLTELNFNR